MDSPSPTDDRSQQVFIVTLIFFTLGSVFVLLRLMFSAALSSSIMYGTYRGLGKLDADIPSEWRESLGLSTYIFTTFYNPALMASKSAILLLYLRMTSLHPLLHRFSLFTLLIVTLSGLVLTFLNIFHCRPVTAAWLPSADAKCIDIVTLYLASAPINVLTDLAILLIPLPVLTAMRLEFRQKVILIGTFITGGFVTIVDVVRIAYLQDALRTEISSTGTGSTSTSSLPDFSYYAASSLMWSAVEVNVGIICACTLVLKPLVMRIVPWLWHDGALGPLGSSEGRRWLGRSGGSGGVRGAGNRLSGMEGGGGESKGEGRGVLQLPVPSPVVPRIRAFGVEGLESVGEECGSTGDVGEKEDHHPAQGDGGPVLGLFGMMEVPSSAGSSGRHGSGDGTLVDIAEPHGRGSTGDPFADLVRDDRGDRPTRKSQDSDRESLNVREFFASLPPPPSPTAVPMSRGTRSWSTSGAGTRSAERRGTLSLLSMMRKPSVDDGQKPPEKFMDFVDLGRRKSLTRLTRREAWWPVMFVSTLFFVWGFSYGLLGTLNGYVQKIAQYNSSQTISLHNGYWVAYFCSPPLVGYWVLSKAGFKATFITGLGVYAVGAMSFWPSSILLSFGGFFISNFLVAFGLALLEIGANTFVALAGPEELSEARLNFAQGIQAIGSILSPVIAERLLFRSVTGRGSLFDTQWLYLGVTLAVVLLGVVFYYVPLSEASDEDLADLAKRRLVKVGMTGQEKIMGVGVAKVAVGIGVAVLGLYVGAQENVSYSWGGLVAEIKPNYQAGSNVVFNTQAASHCIFALGRFVASAVAYSGVSGRVIIVVCLLGSLICSILTMVLPIPSNGTLSMLLLLTFFEAPIFPTVYAMTLRGIGANTKMVSCWLIMSISGGAVFPSISWAVQAGANARKTLPVTVALFGACLVISVVLNYYGAMRRWTDAVPRGLEDMTPDEKGERQGVQGTQPMPSIPEYELRGWGET